MIKETDEPLDQVLESDIDVTDRKEQSANGIADDDMTDDTIDANNQDDDSSLYSATPYSPTPYSPPPLNQDQDPNKGYWIQGRIGDIWRNIDYFKESPIAVSRLMNMIDDSHYDELRLIESYYDKTRNVTAHTHILTVEGKKVQAVKQPVANTNPSPSDIKKQRQEKADDFYRLKQQEAKNKIQEKMAMIRNNVIDHRQNNNDEHVTNHSQGDTPPQSGYMPQDPFAQDLSAQDPFANTQNNHNKTNSNSKKSLSDVTANIVMPSLAMDSDGGDNENESHLESEIQALAKLATSTAQDLPTLEQIQQDKTAINTTINTDDVLLQQGAGFKHGLTNPNATKNNIKQALSPSSDDNVTDTEQHKEKKKRKSIKEMTKSLIYGNDNDSNHNSAGHQYATKIKKSWHDVWSGCWCCRAYYCLWCC